MKIARIAGMSAAGVFLFAVTACADEPEICIVRVVDGGVVIMADTAEIVGACTGTLYADSVATDPTGSPTFFRLDSVATDPTGP